MSRWCRSFNRNRDAPQLSTCRPLWCRSVSFQLHFALWNSSVRRRLNAAQCACVFTCLSHVSSPISWVEQVLNVWWVSMLRRKWCHRRHLLFRSALLLFCCGVKSFTAPAKTADLHLWRDCCRANLQWTCTVYLTFCSDQSDIVNWPLMSKIWDSCLKQHVI